MTEAELRAIELEAYGDWRTVAREAAQPMRKSLTEHWVYLRKRGEPMKLTRIVRKPVTPERDWRARRAEYLRRKA